jgi:hypothetical protein
MIDTMDPGRHNVARMLESSKDAAKDWVSLNTEIVTHTCWCARADVDPISVSKMLDRLPPESGACMARLPARAMSYRVGTIMLKQPRRQRPCKEPYGSTRRCHT